MRNQAKKMHSSLSSRRNASRAGVRKHLKERKWGIGLLLVFGISTVAIGVASNLGTNGTTPVNPPEDPAWPTFKASGINPNLTREDYTVSLNSKGAGPLFDPAGAGSTSLWGLCVDEMTVAYYGADNQWHETSFQINEKGYRWVFNGDDDYLESGRDGTHPVGERVDHAIERMEWRLDYVPSRFYPDLNNIFFPDGPNANKGGAQGGLLPYDTGVMNNWPEFHNTTGDQGWTFATRNQQSQVRGAVDYDDEIVFIAKNGRKVETSIWYRRDLWDHRQEVEIIDPVDNGHCWVYIYYNPGTPAQGPTASRDILNDYCRKLSKIAPGEVDKVSWDATTRTIKGTNFQMQMSASNQMLFSNLQITVPGLTPMNILKQFPKDFIQGDLDIEFGGTTPYGAVRTGGALVYGAGGQWYAEGPPGLGNPSALSGYPGESITPRDYNAYHAHVGFFHHRGDPDQTIHPAYGITASEADLGWNEVGAENHKEPRYWTFSGADVPSGTNIGDGDIALRFRWEDYNGNLAAWGSSLGYSYGDGAIYINNNGTWELVFSQWEDAYGADTSGIWMDRGATIDGPVMAYVERVGALVDRKSVV